MLGLVVDTLKVLDVLPVFKIVGAGAMVMEVVLVVAGALVEVVEMREEAVVAVGWRWRRRRWRQSRGHLVLISRQTNWEEKGPHMLRLTSQPAAKKVGASQGERGVVGRCWGA